MQTARSQALDGSRRVKVWSLAALVTLGLVWMLAMAFAAPVASAHSVDFNEFYAAAQAMRFDHHADVYSIHVLLQSTRTHGICALSGHYIPAYFLPPFFAIALEPLTLLPCAEAAIVWLLMSAAMWAVATLLLADVLARRWPNHRLEAYALVVAMSVGFYPMYGGLFLGQVHTFVLFGFALMFWLLDRNHAWSVGVALGVITTVKVLPATLIIYYLLRGRSRVVSGAALTGLALVIFMAIYAGPENLVNFEKALVYDSFAVLSLTKNESLRETAPAIGLALAALVSAVTVVAILLRRTGDGLLGASMMLCVLLLDSPLVWSFYLVWLIPVFVACFAALLSSAHGGWRNRGLVVTLVVLYVLLAFPLWQQARPFATLALWGLTGALYWRSAVKETPEVPEPSDNAIPVGVA